VGQFEIAATGYFQFSSRMALCRYGTVKSWAEKGAQVSYE
jgi:hypothetical protein